MPIPDNEFSNDYQEVVEEHNVSASMVQRGLKCKYDRPLIRLKNFEWDCGYLYINDILIGSVSKHHILNCYVTYNKRGMEISTDHSSFEEAKKALEDWFINQIGERE